MPVARGFTFSGLHCGIKPFRKDLALIFSESPCSAAATLTTNTARAAPVEDCARRLPASGIRAVLVNSGNANALTGAQGLLDVEALCSATAQVLEVPAQSVLMGSTGVIGQRLPRLKILAALPRLKAELRAAPESAAEAILTTDTHIKVASRAVRFGRREGRITGLCKGSGMIAPQLASTIAIICTDVAIAPRHLQQALVAAMDGSFNNLTIDNDMSTNDAVIALANGQLGNPELEPTNPEYEDFTTQLQSLCVELAKEIARDGEGATRLLEVRVTGAPIESHRHRSRPRGGRLDAGEGRHLRRRPELGPGSGHRRRPRAGARGYALAPAESKVTVQGIVVYDAGPALDHQALSAEALSTNDAGRGPVGARATHGCAPACARPRC